MGTVSKAEWFKRDRISPHRRVWQYRELLYSLVIRNLKIKYQRSLLGFFWTLLNPLLTATVLIVVFSYVVRIQTEHYWAFLLSGYFVWNFVSQMLHSSTYVLREHAQLLHSVAFPKEVLILSTTVFRLVEFGVEMFIALLILIVFHHGAIPSSFVLLPLLVLLQVLIAMGLVMAVSTLSVFFQDVHHMIPIGLLMLFYLSPVFYPVEMVPETIRSFYFLNPIAGLLTLYHSAIFKGLWPPSDLLWNMSIAAFLISIAGYGIFNRYKALYAEII